MSEPILNPQTPVRTMPPRFFSPQPIVSSQVELAGSEQHHLAHVLRIREGACVTLFDDSGAEFTAEVTELKRSTVRLEILARHEVSRELSWPLTLAVALPKGERQQWLVEKAVELGVGQLVPLTCERGVAQPGDNATSRLERWVVAACKQCGRNRLMRIATPQTPSALYAHRDERIVLVAHPSPEARSLRQVLPELSDDCREIVVVIGPEGGFTDDELAKIQHPQVEMVQLGPRILRVETAAISLVASLVNARQ
jgi:16S rRNA (uracil1498-N3)-methyltransferase